MSYYLETIIDNYFFIKKPIIEFYKIRLWKLH